MGIFKTAKRDNILFVENQQIYRYYYDRLVQVALAQFEYSGLPDTCNREFLEKQFLYSGTATICREKFTSAIMSLGWNLIGDYDVYGFPKKITATGYNSVNIETDEFVIGWDNMTRRSILPYIDMYAKLLWQSHMTIIQNLRQQNKPYIVAGSKDTQLSIENFFSSLENFVPYIIINKMGKIGQPLDEQLSKIDLGVPFIGKDLWETHKTLWAEALALLGINAQFNEKKERLLADEVKMNREANDASLSNRLMRRNEFLEKVNKKFNLDITVNVSTNVNDMANIDTPTALTEDKYEGGFGDE